MRKRTPSRRDRPHKRKRTGQQARAGQQTLRSEKIGALPILNHFLRRLRLEEWLQQHLPAEDPRVKIPAAKAILVLLRNLLVSREPLYGLGEWAAAYAPDLLGLTPGQLEALSDDGAGRGLSCLFRCEQGALVMTVLQHTIGEFQVAIEELHNDSTTITLHGNYQAAAEEGARDGRRTLAITWGHNKDHRPDLKQLVYILTLTNDGGVPVHFRAAHGNTTDDQTHIETWKLLCQLAGRKDFLYVADSKLATVENMTSIAGQGGRFVTVLPQTRREDKAFREQRQKLETEYRELMKDPKANEAKLGGLIDQMSKLQADRMYGPVFSLFSPSAGDSSARHGLKFHLNMASGCVRAKTQLFRSGE